MGHMSVMSLYQFGGQARQGGGVTAVEQACWDIAGQAYGAPVHQMLGGKYRDKVRLYTETPSRSDDPKEIGKDLKLRAEAGFTMLKTDLGAEAILRGKPGTFQLAKRPHKSALDVYTAVAHYNISGS
jgi:L-alanine-DL-glutamate epimerase-like enolase superfamily enzyme